MRHIIGITALVLLLCATGTTFAEPDGSPAQDTLRFKAMEQHMIQDLGLTKDQQVKMKSLHADMVNVRKERGSQMRAIMDKSKAELLKDSPSKALLYGLAKEMGEIRTEMAKNEVDHLLKVKSILSPEQFKKLLNKPPRGAIHPDDMDGPGDKHHN